MPKKITRRRPKQKKSASVVLYFIAGAVLLYLVYFLSKDIPAVVKMEQKAKTLVKHKKVKTTHKPIEKKVNKPIESLSVDEQLREILSFVVATQDQITKKKVKGVVSWYAPVDRDNMDLVFANIVLKGKFEQAGYTFSDARESKGRQYITVKDKTGQSHNIELFYAPKDDPKASRKKVIALIVDDFGTISGDLLEQFLAVNKEVCFAILPESKHAVTTMNKAVSSGRECLIHLPMEPLNFPKENPGDKAIFVQLSAKEIESRIRYFREKLPLCSGVNNHMGSLATADEPTMRRVMSALKKDNLYFVDSHTSPASIAYQIAQKEHLQSYRNDIFLDSPDLSDANIAAKLKRCNELAAGQAYVIGIIHCHTRKHLLALQRIISELTADGFTISRVSKLGKYKLPPIE